MTGRALRLALLTALWGCADGASEPSTPQPGAVRLTLSGSTGSLGALSLTFRGPTAGLRAVPGAGTHVEFEVLNDSTAHLAVFGTLPSGELLRLQLSDNRPSVVGRMRVSVLEAAGPDNVLRDAATVTVRVER